MDSHSTSYPIGWINWISYDEDENNNITSNRETTTTTILKATNPYKNNRADRTIVRISSRFLCNAKHSILHVFVFNHVHLVWINTKPISMKCFKGQKWIEKKHRIHDKISRDIRDICNLIKFGLKTMLLRLLVHKLLQLESIVSHLANWFEAIYFFWGRTKKKTFLIISLWKKCVFTKSANPKWFIWY